MFAPVVDKNQNLGLKRGGPVRHPRWGLAHVGGAVGDRANLHSITDGKRLCQNARPLEVKFLALSSWRTRLLPCLKTEVFAA